MSTQDAIGTYRIIAPAAPKKLGLQQGLELADRHVKPLTEQFVHGHIKIHLLVPEIRPVYDPAVKEGSTIGPEFFSGLFEDLIRAERDEKFGTLKSDTARRQIRSVAGTEYKTHDIAVVLSDLFDTAWNIYGPLEQSLHGRLDIGLLHHDERVTMAECDDQRTMKEIENEDARQKLGGWTYKYYKALDGMFISNLNSCALMQAADQPGAAAPNYNR